MAYPREGLFEEIEERLSSDPTKSLTTLSRELGVSRHTLEKAVRGATGISFRDYRKRKRIDRAIDLLSKPNLSIKEIAVILGYKHPQDFSRFVRKATGKSPIQIRERAKRKPK